MEDRNISKRMGVMVGLRYENTKGDVTEIEDVFEGT